MKFQYKIMLSSLMLFVVAFGLGSSILLASSFRSTLDQEEAAAYNAYQMVLYTLDAVDYQEESSYLLDLHNTLYQLDNQTQSWAGLRLKSGNNIIYNSTSSTLSSNIDTSNLTLNQGTLQFCQLNGDWYLQSSGRFLGGDTVLTLEMVYPIQTIFDDRDAQIKIYYGVILCMALMAAFISWLLSRWLTSPLREISTVLRQISQGKLDCRVHLSNQDEIGLLGEDLNQMAQQLESTIDTMKETLQQQTIFMGSFSHELKTPMTAIIGYADLLRSQALSDEDAQKAANYIFSQGQRLEQLSLKLLELLVAKEGNFTFSHVQPKAILEDAVNLLLPTLAQTDIKLQTYTSGGFCNLEPDLFRSLVVNLLDNARKAIGQQGQITVELTVQNQACHLTVTDTGCGMDAQHIKHIQEPFYRVDPSRSRLLGGAGLGLALCHEIVNIHQGTIIFQSQLGQGTSVSVVLHPTLPEGGVAHV